MLRPIHALRNTPIKRKLVIITMATTAAALLLACILTTGYQVYATGESISTDLEITAAMIGDNSASALLFGDADAAATNLKLLQKNQHIISAVVYDKGGTPFAVYQHSRSADFRAPPLELEGSRAAPNRSIRVFKKIELAGDTAGWIFIEADLQQIGTRVNKFLLFYLMAAAAAITTCFFILQALQGAISGPIFHLSAAAQRVASEKDYSIRVAKQGDDELGRLINVFNEMLNQIQQRDSALLDASNTLEKRVEERTEELAHSLALLNATLESTADGVIAFHFGEAEPRYNSQYLNMWGPPQHLTGKSFVDPERLEWVSSQTKDPDDFLKKHAELDAHPEIERFDVIELKDGRIFERYTKPERIGGQVVGVVINFRDITARKQAERELELVHKQLLESSRRAGMAEVASGVLHNVGNVLNSVNVSASLIGENAKNSKAASLAKLVSLLDQHRHELADYIGNDPHGRHLPEFLTQLSRRLLAEQQTTIAEVETLRANIDHIKQIVTMQQTYSKASGFKEIVDVADLVDTALRINEMSLQRHGIQVVRDLAAVPVINTEKHKVLQILVNLIRNAKIACQESERNERQITVQSATEGEHIYISVIDSGVGIVPENLTRIFNHGFTTRKDGHGFGLHSGALAARELGGSLRAYSDGLGCGARFTLELPLHHPEISHA